VNIKQRRRKITNKQKRKEEEKGKIKDAFITK